MRLDSVQESDYSMSILLTRAMKHSAHIALNMVKPVTGPNLGVDLVRLKAGFDTVFPRNIGSGNLWV